MSRTHLKTFLGSTAILASFSSAAVADVTAEEVWENWKGYAESFGQHVEVGSQDYSGGTLRLKDVNISMAFPEGKVSGTMEMLEFQERGDGTVVVTMPADYPFTMSIHPEEGEDVDLALIMRQTGTSIVATGEGDSISYDYLATKLEMSVEKLVVDGMDVNPDITLTMNDVDGKYQIDVGENRHITSEMVAASTDIHVSFSDPKGDGEMRMDGSVADLSSNSDVIIPLEIDMENPEWVFGSDFGMKAGFTSGASRYTMVFVDGSDSFSVVGGSDSASLDVALTDGALNYGGTSTGTKYDISAEKLPFPISVSLAEAGFNLLMPMGMTDEPVDFGFLTKLVDLEVNDAIWDMIDPSQILSRDPATLIVDVVGKVKWLVDITNPDKAAEIGDATPGEIHSLVIRDVTVAVAGAELKGVGEFTFDNTDLSTFDGLPAADGFVDMNIVGANGLMDNLIEMGLLPQEQAMGARMMLGLFARPGDGPDTLTSKIEIKGDGSIFANGQQIK